MESGSPKMPVLFVGHGSPMNAIEDNIFSQQWRKMGSELPRPTAILSISAHWETRGLYVTAMEQPRTIHDFGGFPEELFAAQYPAPGSPELARRIQALLPQANVQLDQKWGLDHGTWSILRQMYPDASIPVVQLSLDRNRSPQEQYDLARQLAPLRQEGVLILGSGNMVHNLGLVVWRGGMDDFNQPFGLTWALEASELFKKLIRERNHSALIHFSSLGTAVGMAIPTPEHFLPLLYVLALQEDSDEITLFNDQAVAGSLTMTSLIVNQSM